MSQTKSKSISIPKIALLAFLAAGFLLGTQAARANYATAQAQVARTMYQHNGQYQRLFFKEEDMGAIDMCNAAIEAGDCAPKACAPDTYLDPKTGKQQEWNSNDRYWCKDWRGADKKGKGVYQKQTSVVAAALTSTFEMVSGVLIWVFDIFLPNTENILEMAFWVPETMHDVWGKILTFTNTALVGFAMIVVVLNLVGYQLSNYAFKTFAPKFILAAIGSNLSWVLAIWALDIGHMAYKVALNINPSTETTIGLAQLIGYNSFNELGVLTSSAATQLSSWAMAGWSFFDMILLFFMLTPVITICLAFMVRYFMIMLQIAIAPFAYAVFPMKPDLFKKYWDGYLSHVFMPALVAFIIAVGILFRTSFRNFILGIPSNAAANPALTSVDKLTQGEISTIDFLLLYAASVVVIFVAAKVSLTKVAYMSHFAGAISGIAKMWGKIPTGALSFGFKKSVQLGKAVGTKEGRSKFKENLKAGFKPGIKQALADKEGAKERYRQTIGHINDQFNRGEITQAQRDEHLAAAAQAQGGRIKGYNADIRERRDKQKDFFKSVSPWKFGGELGKEIAQSDSALKGAKKVWEAWKGEMSGIEEAGALEWGKRIANLGHVANIGTLGVTKGSGLDVGGIKAQLQLKLDMEIAKGVDDKYRDLFTVGTRQQLMAEAKKIKKDAANGDRGAQIALEKILHTVEQKHITFFRADEKEARDLMCIYEEIIKHHEAGTPNMVRDSFANSTGDRLGTMGAKNPFFSGAILRDGMGKGFETSTGNPLHEDPAALPVINLKKVNLDFLKGANGPSLLNAITDGTVAVRNDLSDSITRVLSDPDQCRFFQIPDDTVRAYNRAQAAGRIR